MDALATVNMFYRATDRKDARGLRDLIADDMRFEGPVMRATGAAEYIAMNEQLLPLHQETRMLRQFADGDEVCSIYEMDLATLSGNIITLTMADWLRVKSGRITEQRIYYDAREFARAFGR